MFRFHMAQMLGLLLGVVVVLSTFAYSTKMSKRPMQTMRNIVGESWRGIVRRNGDMVLPFNTSVQTASRQLVSSTLAVGSDIFEEGWPELDDSVLDLWKAQVVQMQHQCTAALNTFRESQTEFIDHWDAEVDGTVVKDVCGFDGLSEIERKLDERIGPGEVCTQLSMVLFDLVAEFEASTSFSRANASDIFAMFPVVASWWRVAPETSRPIFRAELDRWMSHREAFLSGDDEHILFDEQSMMPLHDKTQAMCQTLQAEAASTTQISDEYLSDFVHVLTVTAFAGLPYPHVHDRRSAHRVGWSVYELDNMQAVKRVLSVGNTHHQYIARALQHMTESSKDDSIPFVSYVCDQTNKEARRACQSRSLTMYNRDYPVDVGAPFGEGEVTLLLYDLVDVPDAESVLAAINSQGRYYLPVLNTHHLDQSQSEQTRVRDLVEDAYPHMVSLIDIDFATPSMAVNGPAHVMARNLRAFASITPWARSPRGKLAIDPSVSLTQGAGKVASAAAGRASSPSPSSQSSTSTATKLKQYGNAATLWDQPQLVEMDLPPWQQYVLTSILRDGAPYSGTTADRVDLTEVFDGDCKLSIGSQGECGSCWAWALTLSNEMTRCLRTKQQLERANKNKEAKAVRAEWPSPQYMLNCVHPSMFACRGAYLNTVLDYVGQEDGPGFVSEKCLPYAAGSCRTMESYYGISCPHGYRLDMARMPQCSTHCYDSGEEEPQQYMMGGTLIYRSAGASRHFSAKATAEAMEEHLRKYGAIIAGIETYESFMSYKGGVYSPSSDDLMLGGHAIVIVGYGKDEHNVPYWKVQNSWGKDWGEDGYFRIRRGVNTVGIESSAYGVVVHV